MAYIIMDKMGWSKETMVRMYSDQQFHTIHNYIDYDTERKPILRKGAVSAKKGELLIIPMNMRDGSVNEFTLDESPMAYKPMDEIISNIGDTVDILKVIKPVYNFKAIW